LNILLIQLKRIGDVILTTPCVVSLKAKYPQARITWVLDSACESMDEILPGDQRLYFKKGALNAAFWRTLLFQKWDLCFEFTGTDRGRLVTAMSRASQRVTYKRHAVGLGRHVFNRFIEADVKTLHTVDYHLALVEAPAHRVSGSLIISASLEHKAESLLRSTRIQGPYAIVHPGAARGEKMWSTVQWGEAIRFLTMEKNLNVLITGGRGPEEIAQIDEIIKECASARLCSLAGKTSLSELAAIIAKAQIFVGVDTGASHMADAFQVPSAVLFGGTNPFHWGPRNQNGRAVGIHEFSSYPHDFPKCRMQEIPAENLIGAINSVPPLKAFTD
jgi:ADP-heptose:LPS heptosyltransferase